MKVKVDKGPATALGLCACGDRFLALSRLGALERLARHERIMHPDDRHARALLAQHRKQLAAPVQ